MENKQLIPSPTGKTKVLVILDQQTVSMADALKSLRSADSRSSYIRDLIRAEWKREQKRQQRVERLTP